MKLIECDETYINVSGCRPSGRYFYTVVRLTAPVMTFTMSIEYQFAHLAFETFILHAAYSHATGNTHI